MNISQIAREVGVSRPTVREWLRRNPKRLARSACVVCGHEPHQFERLPKAEYSYLLGVYLGDGMISAVKNKRCFKLRVFMDSRYPNVIREVVGAMEAPMPRSIAAVQPNPRHKRYFFTQVSKDIQQIFCRSCERLGIEYSFSSGGKDVSIARRASVARLDPFVGRKS